MEESTLELMKLIDPRRYDLIPSAVMDGMHDWIKEGFPTGGFLYAVLCNDLREAIGRADLNSMRGLAAIVSWLYNEAPSQCWGSKERVHAWAKKFGRTIEE